MMRRHRLQSFSDAWSVTHFTQEDTLGKSFSYIGIDDDFIKAVQREVTEGSSALFLLTGAVTLDKVQEAVMGDRPFHRLRQARAAEYQPQPEYTGDCDDWNQCDLPFPIHRVLVLSSGGFARSLSGFNCLFQGVPEQTHQGGRGNPDHQYTVDGFQGAEYFVPRGHDDISITKGGEIDSRMIEGLTDAWKFSYNSEQQGPDRYLQQIAATVIKGSTPQRACPR